MALTRTDLRAPRGRPDRRRPSPPAYRPPILRDPSAREGRRRRWLFHPDRRRGARSDAALVVLVVGIGLYLALEAWSATRVHVEVDGLEDGAVLRGEDAAALEVRWAVTPDDRLEGAALTLNGEDILADAEALGDGWRWRPDEGLPHGRHELVLTVPRSVLGDSRHRWTVTVDARPPGIDVPSVYEPMPIDEPVTIRGRVEDGARLEVDGRPVEVDDGGFALRYQRPPAAPVHLEAVDEAGNRSRAEVVVPVRYPGARAVHMSAAAWSDAGKRDDVLALIDSGKVDAVQLDLKDEGGTVGHRSRVSLVGQAGAASNLYDLDDAVRALRERGVRVIGRVVAFRDPVLARWAWERGDRDLVIQQPDGSMHPAYEGFTNFANPIVQRYNIDIALEGVAAGMDDILWDYIRRPEGDLSQMRFPGLRGTPTDGVVAFLAEAHRALRAEGAYSGASVFGIAASRPEAIAQDVSRIARNVDYVSPMVYPSLWVDGEYGVEDPQETPGLIVRESLREFQEVVRGTGRPIVPWLQDFTLGSCCDASGVREQIDGAARIGIDDWLLWNPAVRYRGEALDPLPGRR